jgi:hypothetical protein
MNERPPTEAALIFSGPAPQLGRRFQSWGANPLLKLERGFAYMRRSQESFALRSGRCCLCAPPGFARQLGKSNGQGNGLFFSG